MNLLRAIIVDDEPLARKRIRTLLQHDPEIELIGECGDADAAVAAITELNPDLVLLDVELPGRDAFSIIDQIGVASMPFVLFVTAYDRHAVRAFEVEAVDYLMKPFGNERFLTAMRRAKAVLAARKQLSEGRHSVARMRDPSGPVHRLTVREGNSAILLDVEAIEYVTASGNYVRIHAGQRSYLMRNTIAAIEKLLEPSGFCRTHRSTVVNTAKVRRTRRRLHGDYILTLESGARVKLSRRYRRKLRPPLDPTSTSRRTP